MQAKVDSIRVQYDAEMRLEVILTTKTDIRQEIAELQGIISKGKELSVEIKQYRRKRSLDANAYLWVLCQKIAEVIHSTKELVYRQFIKRVGQFEIMPIKNEAVKRWIEVWESKGLGWVSEVLKDSKLDGYKNVISYYGSSVYDSREMAVLIDEIVTQCKELNIETMTKSEIELLKTNWNK